MKHKNSLSHIKMGREIKMFNDIEIDEQKFHRYKNQLFKKL